MAVVALVTVGGVAPAVAVTPTSTPNPVKVNWLGLYAHPDDDTGIIAPCGVLHEQYGITCGVLAFTRGEGGGNAVGPEVRQDLGIRRENEERVAQAWAGTVKVFYLDAPDFYYNTSAPLTEFFWGHDQTLGRVVRIIRETQPDIITAHSPTGGHGNHQEVGRMAWEGVAAAADPTMFPEQLTGPNALTTWQVKKMSSGGSSSGTGGTNDENCMTGFVPNASNLDTVAGIWNGYVSPYTWDENNPQGQPAGTPKAWAQVASEARAMYPTQGRTMYTGTASPSCSRFGINQAFVPFPANGTPNADLDQSILFGAVMQEPGGLPLGTFLYLTFDSSYNVAGQPFRVTVHARAPKAAFQSASVNIAVPSGWTVGDGGTGTMIVNSAKEALKTFEITPSADAAAGRYKVSATMSIGPSDSYSARTGYTDNVVNVVPAVEGRAQRYQANVDLDQWIARTGSYRFNRSSAVTPIGVGETISVPINLHNWSTEVQSGDVTLMMPAGFSADATTKSYSGLAAGGDTTVTFDVTNTNASLADSTAYTVGMTTSYDTPAGSASENLSLNLVPVTTIPHAAAAPMLDGVEVPGEYTGPALDLSQRWEGSACSPDGTDCGTGTYAKVTWYDDSLYFFIHVVDDIQGTPVVPSDCVAHWRTDSVEILLDPLGDASNTSATFKTGIFPYTDDPTGAAGNGVNGLCWERDADNFQGFGAITAPNMEVISTAVLDAGRTYAGGAYNLEVKIGLEDLPAAVGPTGNPATDVDPLHMGLNITPYDSDTQNLIGKTRLAWSHWGGVQGDPYRWGHAYLDGYTPPAGRPTEIKTPIIDATAALGIDSPQSIFDSVTSGVPLAGYGPVAAQNRLSISSGPALTASSLDVGIKANSPGKVHLFLWTNTAGGPLLPSTLTIPVYNYPYFTTTYDANNNIPPWAPDMTGRLVFDGGSQVVDAKSQAISVPLTAAQSAALTSGESFLLMSFESDAGGVQAFSVPLQ